jgi:hypothetical protein
MIFRRHHRCAPSSRSALLQSYPRNSAKSSAYKVPYILPSSVSPNPCVFKLFTELPTWGLFFFTLSRAEGFTQGEAKGTIRDKSREILALVFTYLCSPHPA